MIRTDVLSKIMPFYGNQEMAVWVLSRLCKTTRKVIKTYPNFAGDCNKSKFTTIERMFFNRTPFPGKQPKYKTFIRQLFNSKVAYPRIELQLRSVEIQYVDYRILYNYTPGNNCVHLITYGTEASNNLTEHVFGYDRMSLPSPYMSSQKMFVLCPNKTNQEFTICV
jgi:hypothetical protein